MLRRSITNAEAKRSDRDADVHRRLQRDEPDNTEAEQPAETIARTRRDDDPGNEDDEKTKDDAEGKEEPHFLADESCQQRVLAQSVPRANQPTTQIPSASDGMSPRWRRGLG